jgi:DNA-directed RNA polymerase subunit RPC12/RpoP
MLVGTRRLSAIMSAIQYRCPDCEQQITFLAEQVSDDSDGYESALCPNCRELHSVNRATGQVLAEDELGDPW